MNFRKDINGLRAIAVIAVVLFHFNSAWMPGGFAGVDVFFVISGFLMTGIIFRGIEQENFSILKFYIARANRIIPALAVLCITILIFGWFYLTPFDYKALGKHVSSSIGFFSNITYWKESGYFDAASHEKWLLHTWSLSAEWQFYMIYPLILVALKKVISLKSLKITILIGTILGFIYSAFATYQWPDSSYYLLTTRAWEMMIGGVAYLFPIAIHEKRKKFIEWFGLALIISSYFLISNENPWPGYLAIIPVLGAFLIIQAQRDDSFITSNIVSQKIGAWSYSIYLWHWPLVVAIYYFSLNEVFIYIGLGLSVLLGFLSNKYIERIKFQNNFTHIFSYLKCKPAYMTVVIGCIGIIVYKTDGVKQHYPLELIQAEAESLNRNPYKCMIENKFPCYIGNKDNIKAIIVGDSHADALTTALAESVDLKNEGIIALSKSSCPVINNAFFTNSNGECNKSIIKRMEFLDKNYPSIPVFWVSRTGAYLYGQSNPIRINGEKDTQPIIYFNKQYTEANESLYAELKSHLDTTIAQISHNHPVYIVQPIPEMRRNIPKTLAKNMILNRNQDDLSISYDIYLERNKQVRLILNDVAESNNSTVLDPIPYLCENNRCMAQFKGRPIYFDGDHLSEYGNKLLTPMFKGAMKNH